MVEQIPSGEAIGDASLSLGEAPKHTQDEHIKCAYYLTTMRADPGGGHPAEAGLRCPHGAWAEGAFYSEDWVLQVRVAMQKLTVELNDPAVRSQLRLVNRDGRTHSIVEELEGLTS